MSPLILEMTGTDDIGFCDCCRGLRRADHGRLRGDADGWLGEYTVTWIPSRPGHDVDVRLILGPSGSASANQCTVLVGYRIWGAGKTKNWGTVRIERGQVISDLLLDMGYKSHHVERGIAIEGFTIGVLSA